MRPLHRSPVRQEKRVSIHAPRVGCDRRRLYAPNSGLRVSIHAPRVGCDASARAFSSLSSVFQFTHPVWGATEACSEALCGGFVSIHAPRVGCDTLPMYFRISALAFQFTHPVWGATNNKRKTRAMTQVSIHAPRVGCDHSLRYNIGRDPNGFNSRTPCGVRLTDYPHQKLSYDVSIHAPRVGCDRTPLEGILTVTEFQFTHPVWGATLEFD